MGFFFVQKRTRKRKVNWLFFFYFMRRNFHKHKILLLLFIIFFYSLSSAAFYRPFSNGVLPVRSSSFFRVHYSQYTLGRSFILSIFCFWFPRCCVCPIAIAVHTRQTQLVCVYITRGSDEQFKRKIGWIEYTMQIINFK